MGRKLGEPFYPGCGSYETVELTEAVLTWWYLRQLERGERIVSPLDEEGFREACGFLYREAIAVTTKLGIGRGSAMRSGEPEDT